MPRWVVANEDDEGDASSTEEDSDGEAEPAAANDATESGEEDEEEESAVPEPQEAAPGAASSGSQAKGKKSKLSISLGGLVCHVCGKKGHNAGFVGSVYMDCPNRPCYLCKKPGHTTMTCPYRVGPDHSAKHSATSTGKEGGMLASIFQSMHDGRKPEIWKPCMSWQVESAVLKLHARRCTCLQFHPTRHNLVLSGDKQGQIAVWDHMKVYERTVWRPNQALTNNLCFLPGGDGMSCFSASADGTLKVLDVETGLHREVLNMNPDGWIPGVSNERNWVMLYGLDVCGSRSLVSVGDSQGRLHFLDARSDAKIATHQLHKKANKVNSVQFSPADENLMVTGSNDWTARLFDLRKLSDASAAGDTAGASNSDTAAPMELARIEHPKVVNSAYFSPRSGRKLMTTCIDNRIRVWDYLLTVDQPPTREIVHSHDFNRYLTPFRAEWDPKDSAERLIVVGRYISEDFGGVALHPVDLIDASSGRLLEQLRDPNLTTICPVNKVSPYLDLIVSGSSRSLYAWRPTPTEEESKEAAKANEAALAATTGVQAWDHGLFFDAGVDEQKKSRKRNSGGGGGGGESLMDDDDDEGPSKPEKKTKKPGAKASGSKASGVTKAAKKGDGKDGKKPGKRK